MHPWPCLIYPSWSIAIRHSGLFPDYKHQPDARHRNADDLTLRILSCKKRVKLSDLANNRVPLRVALNPGRSDGDATSLTSGSSKNSSDRRSSRRQRSKVVVHFLGVNEWYVASIGDLTQYTSETAMELLKRVRISVHSRGDYNGGLKRCSTVGVGKRDGIGSVSSSTESKNKKRKSDDINYLSLLAMKEASIACEGESSFGPSALFLQCKDGGDGTDNVSRTSDTVATHKNTNSYKNTNSSINKIMVELLMQMGEPAIPMHLGQEPTEEKTPVEDTGIKDCTPECFDDWRAGGNTQRLTDSQSQFLLTGHSKTQ